MYDSQAWDAQSSYGGISRCFTEIFNGVRARCDAFTSLQATDNQYLLSKGIRGIMDSRQLYEMFKARYLDYSDFKNAVGLGNRTLLMDHLKENDFDVFHPTHYSMYWCDGSLRKPFVVTIHDMIPEVYRDRQERSINEAFGDEIHRKRMLIEHADAVIAISQTTKDDILRFCDVSEDKVHVIHHGVPPFKNIIYRDIIGKPYVLYVGNRFGVIDYKKFPQFIREMAAFMNTFPETQLVFTGNKFDPFEEVVLKDAGILQRCISMQANDMQLANLYKHAIAFVYPSEYEGFGLPILECVNNGGIALVNASNKCFREVCHGLVRTFTFSEKYDLSMQLGYLYKHTDRKEVFEKQLPLLEEYSMDKCIDRHIELYNTLLR